MKRKILILGFAEFTERFGFFGVLAILVLQLHKSFQLSETYALSVFSIFISLSYALQFFGGYLTDRWLNRHVAVPFSCGALVVANMFMAIPNVTFVYLGMSLVVVGTGLFKVNNISLVGQLYSKNSVMRERAYTFVYGCMNLGAISGPVVYGVMRHYLHPSSPFILTAVLLIFVWRLLSWLYQQHSATKQKKQLNVIWVLLSIVGLGAIGFQYAEITNYVMLFVLLLPLVLMVFAVLKLSAAERKTIWGISLLCLGCTFFFACSLQVTSSILLFVYSSVKISVAGVLIPAPVFSAIDPVFVIFMAPVAAYLWQLLKARGREPNVMTKVGFGIFLAALAFMSFACSALSIHSGVIIFLLLGYLLLGFGEIAMVPAVLSAISHHAPEHLRNSMMGLWFLFVAIGGYTAGQLSKLLTIKSGVSFVELVGNHFSSTFMIVALFALLFSSLAYCVRSRVVKLLT